MKEIANWIWLENLQPFVDVLARLAGYELSELDWDAIRLGVEESDGDATPPRFYSYEFYGESTVCFQLGLDQGSDVVQVRLKVPATLAAEAGFAIKMMNEYRLT